MPRRLTTTKQPASLLSRMRTERRAHADVLARIDAVFERLGVAPTAPKHRCRPPRTTAVAVAKVAPAKPKRRAPGTFTTTGPESFLALLKGKGAKEATSAEIARHRKSEGRGPGECVILSKLVKAKRLKNEPVGGRNGGKYMIA
jgi:hypothetical protein